MIQHLIYIIMLLSSCTKNCLTCSGIYLKDTKTYMKSCDKSNRHNDLKFTRLALKYYLPSSSKPYLTQCTNIYLMQCTNIYLCHALLLTWYHALKLTYHLH